jgi:hypothetical protein
MEAPSVPTNKVLTNLRAAADAPATARRVVLVSTGAYCPIHAMHTEVFERIKTSLESNKEFIVVGGYEISSLPFCPNCLKIPKFIFHYRYLGFYLHPTTPTSRASSTAPVGLLSLPLYDSNSSILLYKILLGCHHHPGKPTNQVSEIMTLYANFLLPSNSNL